MTIVIHMFLRSGKPAQIIQLLIRQSTFDISIIQLQKLFIRKAQRVVIRMVHIRPSAHAPGQKIGQTVDPPPTSGQATSRRAPSMASGVIRCFPIHTLLKHHRHATRWRRGILAAPVCARRHQRRFKVARRRPARPVSQQQPRPPRTRRGRHIRWKRCGRRATTTAASSLRGGHRGGGRSGCGGRSGAAQERGMMWRIRQTWRKFARGAPTQLVRQVRGKKRRRRRVR